MKEAVKLKSRVLLIGGKKFNVPRQFADHFEIVRHIEQEEKRFQSMPRVDYVVIITNWVNHSAVQAATQGLPGVPLVYVRAGWKSMVAEFVKRGMMEVPTEPVPDDPPEVEEAAPPPPEPAPSGKVDSHEALKRAEDMLVEYLMHKEERQKVMKEVGVLTEKLRDLDKTIAELKPVAEAIGLLTKAVHEVMQ